MRIPETKPLLPQLKPPGREQLLQNLRLGQVVQAVALSENLEGQIRLRIGAIKLLAQTRLMTTPGQTLTLQVDKEGNFPVLKLLSQVSSHQVQSNAIKSALPRQLPLPELFQQLRRIDQATTSDNPPSEIKLAVRELIGRLLSPEQAQFREGLKALMQYSGLLTESSLLQQILHGSDLKLNLLRLVAQIKTLLAQQHLPAGGKSSDILPDPTARPQADESLKQLTALLKLLDGALARIQTHQLASLPQEESNRQVWQFELPLLYRDEIDLAQIKIQQEDGKTAADPTTVWTLNLQMNLRPLGPMHIRLRLTDKSLATMIGAERQQTIQLIESQLPSLRQAFEQAGLEVSRLQAYQTKLAEPKLVPRIDGLVSEKA